MLTMVVLAVLVLHHPSLAHKFNMLVEAQGALMTLIAAFNWVLLAAAMVVGIPLEQHQV
jgi:hypothetical protein